MHNKNACKQIKSADKVYVKNEMSEKKNQPLQMDAIGDERKNVQKIDEKDQENRG